MRNVSREEGIGDAGYMGDSAEALFFDESGVTFT
jgi:hypothetical protein